MKNPKRHVVHPGKKHIRRMSQQRNGVIRESAHGNGLEACFEQRAAFQTKSRESAREGAPAAEAPAKNGGLGGRKTRRARDFRGAGRLAARFFRRARESREWLAGQPQLERQV